MAKRSSTDEEKKLHKIRVQKCQERCKVLNDPNAECVHHCELLP
jgi:hypothetical protein